MKSLALTLCVAALTLSGLTRAEDAVELKNDKDKISYSIGQQIGMSLQDIADELDMAVLIRGLNDKLKGLDGSKMSKDDVQKLMTAFQTDLNVKIPAKHKAAGEKFLAENKTKEGVKTTASGLQYKVLKEGDGALPTGDDTVSTHYKGTLINGTQFDSSYDRGQPAQFPVKGVIKGWTEALQLMKTGSKWQLYIPAELAYGEHPPTQAIPPNSVLVFEIELISIDPKK